MSESTSQTDPKAKSSEKSGEGPQQPQWDKVCLCGERLGGPRPESCCSIACPKCRRPHLVLAVSPYPAPKRIKRTRRKSTEPVGAKLAGFAKSGGKAGSALVSQLLTQCKLQILRLGRAIRKEITPLRVAIAAIMVAVFVGSGFAMRQRWMANAKRDLRDAVTLAEEAYAQANWPLATEQYARAAQAVRELGREDSFAQEVLQKDRELSAIAGLCSFALPDIINDAERPGMTLMEWQNQFDLSVKDRWLVTETWLGGKSENGNLRQTIPMGEQTIVVEWPENLSLGQSLSSGSDHVLIAGKYAEIKRAEDDPIADWLVRLDQASVFLWCNPESCAALGFELESPWTKEDSLKSILAQQRSQVLGENSAEGSVEDID